MPSHLGPIPKPFPALRPTVSLALAILLAMGCGGGAAGPAGSPSTPTPTEPSAPALPPELAEDHDRQGRVEVESDPEMDVRTWQLIPMRVTEPPFIPGVDEEGSELRMGALGMVTGPQHPLSPSQAGAQLFFMGISSREVYQGAVDYLRLRIDDGEVLPIPVTTYRDSPTRVYVLETIGLQVPPELLAALAQASSVEGELGPTRFELGPEHLERFREFVRQLPPELQGAAVRIGWRKAP